MEDAILSEKRKIKTSMNKDIGFLMYFNSNDDNDTSMAFFTKDLTKPRSKGVRCDKVSMKENSINLLNNIINAAIGSKINLYGMNENELSQKKICIIQEIYLRLFDEEQKNKKRWFLSPPEALLVEFGQNI